MAARLVPATVAMAVAMLVTAASATGCGVRPTGIISAGDAPEARAPVTDDYVYFVFRGKLRQVQRPGLPGTPLLAFDQLAEGPTRTERTHGLRTELAGLVYDWLQLDRGRLTVGLNALSTRSPGTWSRLARAQLACTAEEIQGVERVVVSYHDRGRVTETAITCDEFRDLQG